MLPVDPVNYLKEHYVHELNMVRQTYYHHQVAKDDVTKNALYDAFCVHGRVLAHFFSPRKTHGKDVLALHFAPNWLSKSTHVSRLPKSILENINKRVAHLSEERAAPNIIIIKDMTDLLTAINLDHALFAAKVDAQYRNCFAGVATDTKALWFVRTNTANTAIQSSSTTFDPNAP